jgi:rhodanese-related sulfurtransferase
MRTIGHEELKHMLDQREDFRLVMALGEWAYQAKHIRGSLHFATMRDALQSLQKEDEIVVYCSDENCIASKALGQLLERNGYSHVLHFAGGLEEWEQAGYPEDGRVGHRTMNPSWANEPAISAQEERFLRLLRSRLAWKQDGHRTCLTHPLPPLIELVDRQTQQEGDNSSTGRDPQREGQCSHQEVSFASRAKVPS